MRQECFLPFGVHTQLQADSSSDFAIVSKDLRGTDQLLKGLILQSFYLLDSLVVCLLFRVSLRECKPLLQTAYISELLLEFFIHSVYVYACRCMMSSSL